MVRVAGESGFNTPGSRQRPFDVWDDSFLVVPLCTGKKLKPVCRCRVRITASGQLAQMVGARYFERKWKANVRCCDNFSKLSKIGF